ncbi:MAG: hypothetical protein ABW168_23235 [Sedimenticola sp.]
MKNLRTEAIYRIKIAVVNEFRYYYGEHGTGGMLTMFSNDNSLKMDTYDLQESSLISIDPAFRRSLEENELKRLFHDSLIELYEENLIVLVNENIVVMTPKAEKIFFKNGVIYSEYASNATKNNCGRS